MVYGHVQWTGLQIIQDQSECQEIIPHDIYGLETMSDIIYDNFLYDNDYWNFKKGIDKNDILKKVRHSYQVMKSTVHIHK